jgi:hypothetical protein
MQKKLNKTETRLTQGSMDKILRKRRERKSIAKYTPVFSKQNPPKTVMNMPRKAKAFSTNSNCINPFHTRLEANTFPQTST